ncbi:DinB family protein [Zhouia amylolytica]|uniref:Putative DNA polymerase, DinB family n=1 Tax=Zhouia amylolytica AD3 TaxID=1286632 RepID=W2UMT3_9FLAO|nr:DinB family protein [Zhouia amylolytica]ETN94766.1 putative DNA polymerase, DinB family [Zhouia amylolytica AD3]
MNEVNQLKQRYIDYANYNIWANNRLISDLLAQEEGIMNKEVAASFSSIRATVLHIWAAETGWLSRLKGNGWSEVSKVRDFSGSNQSLFKAWQETSEEFKNFLVSADLEEEVSFEQKEEKFSIPAREITQTVFNHGSYHRGQVVMMMRQLGVSKITQTDYIEWCREKQRGNV